MGDDQWGELITSPYDADPKEPLSMWRIVAIYVVAAVVGIGAGWLVSQLGGEEVAALSTTSTEAVTTTTVPRVLHPIFLDGFTETGASAVRPVLHFQHDGRRYVAVSEIIRSDGDRATVGPLVTGRWAMGEAAAAVVANREITAVMSPGIRLVEFDGVANADLIQVWRGTTPDEQTSCVGCFTGEPDGSEGDIEIDLADLPLVLTEAISSELDRGLSFVVDTLAIDMDWGYADWHAVGDEDATLSLDIIVVFPGTGSEDAGSPDPAQLLAAHHLGPTFGQSQAAVLASPTRAGGVELYRRGPPITSENHPSTAVVRWLATWTYPVNEALEFAMPPVLDLDSNRNG